VERRDVVMIIFYVKLQLKNHFISRRSKKMIDYIDYCEYKVGYNFIR